MITMSLFVLLGVIALALLSVFFTSRRSAGLAAVVRDVEKELAVRLKHDEAADVDLAQAIEAGVSIDRAIADFQAARASALPNSGRTAAPHLWSEDDLAEWRDREIIQRGEEVNRRLITPAIGAALATIAVTVTAVAVNYSFFSTASADATAETIASEPTPAISFPDYDNTPPSMPVSEFPSPIDSTNQPSEPPASASQPQADASYPKHGSSPAEDANKPFPIPPSK